MICKHCEKVVLKNETAVEWPWVHGNGFYQCAFLDVEAYKKVGFGVKAEPKED